MQAMLPLKTQLFSAGRGSSDMTRRFGIYGGVGSVLLARFSYLIMEATVYKGLQAV